MTLLSVEQRVSAVGLLTHLRVRWLTIAPVTREHFEAAAGLLGMIELVEGRRAAVSSETQSVIWEGWILGQTL